ncbi:2-oxo-4-hydroxy-4-carboxy-5-ureidoimidazoline decarboxylase [Peribacillus kribbensis]|uniref:2-oxo-4-hydroxy-4-carboxy-5-ureidoimidazoline decarboxylase n=1 Tax=Peribacillus kribbensis TaxID=356658 RepID=UPI000402ACDB
MEFIEKINQTNTRQFVEMVGGVFEHSPWIAEEADALKPFSSLSHLHERMVAIVKNAPSGQQLALIQAHPNLGEKAAMTDDSKVEQKGAGLQDLSLQEYEQFISLNQTYMETFGFPFILAVRGKNKYEIYQSMKERLENSTSTEFQTALEEIYKIAWLRLMEKAGENAESGFL